MRGSIVCVLACLLLIPAPASAHADGRQQKMQSRVGVMSATFAGTIEGYQHVDYQVSGKAGQRLSVDCEASNASAYFNITQSGAGEALFNGPMNGNHFEAVLPTDGTYTIRVYIMRNAARRNEAAKYALTVRVT
jgi:hypothetical protein